MKNRVNIVAVTNTERQTVVDAIGRSLSDVGGWLDDINFFSNISVAVRSFIPSRQASMLGNELVKIGLKIDKETVAELDEISSSNPPDLEILCSLQVTFFHNEPDLRRHIPSVPG